MQSLGCIALWRFNKYLPCPSQMWRPSRRRPAVRLASWATRHRAEDARKSASKQKNHLQACADSFFSTQQIPPGPPGHPDLFFTLLRRTFKLTLIPKLWPCCSLFNVCHCIGGTWPDKRDFVAKSTSGSCWESGCEELFPRQKPSLNVCFDPAPASFCKK